MPESETAAVPRFRNPATGKALTAKAVRADVTPTFASSSGLDGLKYGAYSLRIGGATALRSEGAPGRRQQAFRHLVVGRVPVLPARDGRR